MDMSDPHGAKVEPASAPDEAKLDEGQAAQHWLDLVSEFGADVAGPLTAALERIDALTTSGRITRADLRALREEVQQARQAGLLGQQLTILASGRLHHTPERLVLDDMVKGVLGARACEVPARVIALEVATEQAEVMVDATLMFSLLNTLFDWALDHTSGRCEFRTGAGSAAGYVRLECVAGPAVDVETSGGGGTGRPRRLNALTWRILEQTAAAMGLVMERHDDGREVRLTLQFARAPTEVTIAIPLDEPTRAAGPADPLRTLAGSQVLVISSRREMRVQIRDALRSMGLIIDFVSSVNEAAQFCDAGVPDAIIIESIQRGERFAKFREELHARVPNVAFIEVVEQGRTFERSGVDGALMGRVGRDAVDAVLPAALMYELSRGR
jgi:CheY-like chemotaxis protein